MSSKAVALNLLPLRGYSTAAEAAHHVNETSMRDLDKGLIVLSAHVRFLLPEDVFPHHNGPDSLLDAQINDATACLVQIVLDAAIALRRDLIESTGGVAFVLAFAESFLMMFALLIVVLVQAFDGLAADQTRDKTFFVARDCC